MGHQYATVCVDKQLLQQDSLSASQRFQDPNLVWLIGNGKAASCRLLQSMVAFGSKDQEPTDRPMDAIQLQQRQTDTLKHATAQTLSVCERVPRRLRWPAH